MTIKDRSQIFEYPNPGTFSIPIPDGAVRAQMWLQAGGGGGGAGSGDDAFSAAWGSGGGGGASGEYKFIELPSLPTGATIDIKVGAGGLGGLGHGNYGEPGTNGGNSTITIGGTVYQAIGGNGAPGVPYNGSGIGYGAIGTGNFESQSGHDGYQNFKWWKQTETNANSTNFSTGGYGGASHFGPGGDGGGRNASGNTASFPGAGGGGSGGGHNAQGFRGGDGGNGYVKIIFYSNTGGPLSMSEIGAEFVNFIAPNVFDKPGTYSYTVPTASITKLNIMAIGPGGGGGGGGADQGTPNDNLRQGLNGSSGAAFTIYKNGVAILTVNGGGGGQGNKNSGYSAPPTAGAASSIGLGGQPQPQPGQWITQGIVSANPGFAGSGGGGGWYCSNTGNGHYAGLGGGAGQTGIVEIAVVKGDVISFTIPDGGAGGLGNFHRMVNKNGWTAVLPWAADTTITQADFSNGQDGGKGGAGYVQIRVNNNANLMPMKLSQFYRGGGRVADITKNAAIPKSGTDKFSFYYGTTNYVSGSQTFSVGTYNFTVPTGVYELNTDLLGGGGGGSAGNDGGYIHAGSGGLGGGAGGYRNGVRIAVTPGEVLTIVVGHGGAGGNSSCWYGGAGSPGGATAIYRGSKLLAWVPGGIGGQATDRGTCGTTPSTVYIGASVDWTKSYINETTNAAVISWKCPDGTTNYNNGNCGLSGTSIDYAASVYNSGRTQKSVLSIASGEANYSQYAYYNPNYLTFSCPNGGTLTKVPYTAGWTLNFQASVQTVPDNVVMQLAIDNPIGNALSDYNGNINAGNEYRCVNSNYTAPSKGQDSAIAAGGARGSKGCIGGLYSFLGTSEAKNIPGSAGGWGAGGGGGGCVCASCANVYGGAGGSGYVKIAW